MKNDTRYGDVSAVQRKNEGLRRHRVAAQKQGPQHCHRVMSVVKVAERFLRPGTVVRADMPYHESHGSKVRPVVVLSRVGRRVTVMPITTSARADYPGDLPLEDLASAGLHRRSRVRTFRTVEVDRTAVIEVLGVLGPRDLDRIFGSEVA